MFGLNMFPQTKSIYPPSLQMHHMGAVACFRGKNPSAIVGCVSKLYPPQNSVFRFRHGFETYQFIYPPLIHVRPERGDTFVYIVLAGVRSVIQ